MIIQSTLADAPRVKSLQDTKYMLYGTLFPRIPDCIMSRDPILAGGFAAALIFAPKTRIGSDFYRDIDVYAHDQKHFEQLKRGFNLAAQTTETDNAISISIAEGKYQLIKRTIGSPKEILSNFDMYNAMVAVDAVDESVYYHANTPKHYAKQQIEIADQHLLVKLRDNKEEMVLQILRFAKYAARWSSEAGPRLFMALLQEYYKNPNLSYTLKTFETQQNSSETQPAIPIEINQNVWEFIAPLLTTSKWWADHLDPIGIIKKQQKMILPQPEVVIGFDEPTAYASHEI